MLVGPPWHVNGFRLRRCSPHWLRLRRRSPAPVRLGRDAPRSESALRRCSRTGSALGDAHAGPPSDKLRAGVPPFGDAPAQVRIRLLPPGVRLGDAPAGGPLFSDATAGPTSAKLRAAGPPFGDATCGGSALRRWSRRGAASAMLPHGSAFGQAARSGSVFGDAPRSGSALRRCSRTPPSAPLPRTGFRVRRDGPLQ
jgi:hypothetical protein